MYGYGYQYGKISGSGGGLPFTPPLDVYTGAAAAYSLRLLRTAYAGSAIRVRRSSDNAEQDIGFVSGVLDTASLLTFCGAGDGFVTTMYNQATGSNHAIQTTAANQPKIVNAGTLVTTNGKASIDFDGTNDFLVINTETTWLGSYTNLCIAEVFKMDAVSNITLLNSKTFVTWTSGTDTRVMLNSTILPRQEFTFVTGTQYLSFLNGSSASVDRHINNSLNADGSADGISTSSNNTYIGSYTNGALAFMYDGTRQEIIFWKADQSANRAGIQTNINSYYGIY